METKISEGCIHLFLPFFFVVGNFVCDDMPCRRTAGGGLGWGIAPYAGQFVETVGILERTILTLEKIVSTLDFSNLLTVFGLF